MYCSLFIGAASATPLVMTLEKTESGYRRTNALSHDSTFDIVWAALRNGEVIAGSP